MNLETIKFYLNALTQRQATYAVIFTIGLWLFFYLIFIYKIRKTVGRIIVAGILAIVIGGMCVFLMSYQNYVEMLNPESYSPMIKPLMMIFGN